MNTLYKDMEVSIKNFFIDLFSSFKYDKELIDEQITRDFDRLTLYFNDNRIHKKSNYYFLLHIIYTYYLINIVYIIIY